MVITRSNYEQIFKQEVERLTKIEFDFSSSSSYLQRRLPDHQFPHLKVVLKSNRDHPPLRFMIRMDQNMAIKVILNIVHNILTHLSNDRAPLLATQLLRTTIHHDINLINPIIIKRNPVL